MADSVVINMSQNCEPEIEDDDEAYDPGNDMSLNTDTTEYDAGAFNEHITATEPAESISYNMRLYLSVLEMLETRGSGYRDVVETQRPSVLKHTNHRTFQIALLVCNNRLRDLIAINSRTTKELPSFRTLMSFLTVNNNGYTAVFFADNSGRTQVAKSLIVLFIQTLVYLNSLHVSVNEVIIVTPSQLSHDAESRIRSFISGSKSSSSNGMIVQIFRDEEVIFNPTLSIWAPKFEVVPESETYRFISEEFGSTDPNTIKAKLQRISHSDIQIKYLGIRPGRVVKVNRRPIVPRSLISNEHTFAWVF